MLRQVPSLEVMSIRHRKNHVENPSIFYRF